MELETQPDNFLKCVLLLPNVRRTKGLCGDVGSTGLNKEKPASLLQEFPDCTVFMWGVRHQEERGHTAFLQCVLGTLIVC